MVGSLRINERLFSLAKTRIVKKKTIIAGLKSDHLSREMLLRLLNFIVLPGDSVLAVHVQDPNEDTFDPNTFHIHEDLCKSKQVDFQVKICVGSSSYVSELSHQVRVNFATMLAIGCSEQWPEDSTISRCLKTLPPSCTLLVINNRGKIVLQMQGTSQQGSVSRILQASFSSIAYSSCYNNSETKFQLQKSLTMPCSSSTSSQPQQTEMPKLQSTKKRLNHPDAATTHRLFETLAAIEVKGHIRRFTLKILKSATNNFCPEMLIGEGGHSKVYRAYLGDGQAAAVKVLNMSQHSEEDLFREVEMLSGLRHENIIKLLGYCFCREVQAVVYNLLKASLRQRLKQLGWDDRMKITVGVAKALDYLHSSSPPIIHRDVKSSNILLSENGQQPQLSDFGGAMVNHQIQQASFLNKPIHVVGTFGYLAPEYMMYGKVDEKIDVFSYGVVLLELITGKEAIQTKSSSNQESLVLWARSLLSNGLCDRLIDPNLEDDYNKDEMKIMIIAARLCLLHSSSRRPTMKKILNMFEEPDRLLEMQKERDELLNVSCFRDETELCMHQESDFNGSILMDDG